MIQYSEHLQEALLHLEHARKQEEQRRVESEAVLEGLSALLSAKNREDVMETVTKAFQKLTHCDICMVMLPQDGFLVDETRQLRFPIYKAFQRVLKGRVLNAFDVSQIAEWSDVPMKGVGSALHLPLKLPSMVGMLILTSPDKMAFSNTQVDLVRRVIPFSEQAVAKIEAIEEEHAEEVREQWRIMQLILNHAPVGIWMLSAEGKIQFVNQTFCEGVGVDERRFLSAEHYASLFADEVAAQCVRSDQACFASKTSVYSREVLPCVDGKLHTFDVTKVPVLDGDGRVSCLIAIAVDVTDKLEAEYEKEDMQKQILHAQKLESLGVLAGGIAHDFNNILTAIMGHASLAEMEAGDQPYQVQRHLEVIVSASEKAADLCKQMLAYSGKGKFFIQPVDVSDLIQGITSILEVSLNKGVGLEMQLGEHLPMIEADSSQVQQVIMNLITNANEAIESKSGLITIRTGEMYAHAAYLQQCLCADDAEPAHYVFIEVADTGCGMSLETMGRVFDPFFSTKFTGRGLGMSAVLGIVRGHHGVLKVDSQPGKGTVFRVLFPALDSALLPKGEPQEECSLIVSEAMSVLVVDDEESIREMAKVMLEDIGIVDVMMAADGLEAVDVYKQAKDKIALVLLDLTMPHMDGEETLGRLQSINPDVKVILSSGYSESDIQSRFVGKGLCGFVQKPYLPKVLQKAVQNVFENGNV